MATGIERIVANLDQGPSGLVTALNTYFTLTNPFTLINVELIRRPTTTETKAEIEITAIDKGCGGNYVAIGFEGTSTTSASSLANTFFAATPDFRIVSVLDASKELRRSQINDALIVIGSTDFLQGGHPAGVGRLTQIVVLPNANIAAGASGAARMINSSGVLSPELITVTNISASVWTSGTLGWAIADPTYTSCYIGYQTCGVGSLDTLSTLYDGVNQYTDLGYDGAYDFDNTDAFTISWWAKNGDSQDMHWSKSTNPAASIAGYDCHVRDNGANLWFGVKDGTNRLRAQVAHTNNDGVWHHYVAVYHGDDATVDLYKDNVIGTQVEAGPLTGNIQNDIEFELAEASGKHFLGGNIDEFSVWTGAANAADVNAIYNGGKPTSLTALALTITLSRWQRMGELTTNEIGLDSAGVMANPVTRRYHRILSQNPAGGLNKRIQRFQLFSFGTQITPDDLTNNTSHSPFVTDASVDAANAFKVGDGLNNTQWSAGNPAIGEWVSWDLGTAAVITDIRVRSFGAGRNIAPFDYQVSDDNAAWTTVLSVPDQGSQFDKTYIVPPLSRGINSPTIVMDVP